MHEYWDRLSFRRTLMVGAILSGLETLGLSLYAAVANPTAPGCLFTIFAFVFGWFVYQFQNATYSIMLPPSISRRLAAGSLVGAIMGVGVGCMMGWGGGPPLGEPHEPRGLWFWLIISIPFFTSVNALVYVLIVRPTAEPRMWPGASCAGCGRRWKLYWVRAAELSYDEGMNFMSYYGSERAISCDFCGSIRCLQCNLQCKGFCPTCHHEPARSAWVVSK